MPKRVFSGGWRPDVPDKRDFTYQIRAVSNPPLVDMRTHCPPVRDQGQLGSCTSFAITGAVEFNFLKLGHKDFEPSELFVYYNERLIEGSTGQDAGAYLRDGAKAINTYGVAPEKDWPYDINKFANKPSNKSYLDARKDRAVQYARVQQQIDIMKTCLAQGNPFVIGFTVYDSFMTDAVAANGIVPMPDFTTESVQGGHAVCVVGYDDSNSWWIVRNSWSDQWGDKGYFYMPYQYFTDNNLADDLWTFTLVK